MNNTATCSTCRYWTEDGPSRGVCKALRMMPLRGQVTECVPHEYPDVVTTVFRPAATFGCVLHER